MANDEQSAPRKETWRDWLPPDIPAPPDEELIGREELLSRLRFLGVGISERTLKLWEELGILPRPERRWFNGATRALYPPWAVYLVSLADGMRPHRSTDEELGELTRASVRYFVLRDDVWEWPAVRDPLLDALTGLAERYAAVTGKRAAKINVGLMSADGEVLDAHYIDLGDGPQDDL